MVGDGNHCIDSTRERLAIIIEIIVQSIAVFFLLLQTFFFHDNRSLSSCGFRLKVCPTEQYN